jgi:hypothetical protein
MVYQNWDVRDGVHEWHIHLDSFSNQIFNFTKHGQVVLGFDVFGVRSVETCNETSKRRDAYALADTKNGLNEESISALLG